MIDSARIILLPDSTAYAPVPAVTYTGTAYVAATAREEKEQEELVLTVMTLTFTGLVVLSFFLLNWINGRYWDRGIFPPFLRFRRLNYYDAVVHLAANIIVCDNDARPDKHMILQHYMHRKFPDVDGGVFESFRTAECEPVSTSSIARWLKKHLKTEEEKQELLQLLFRLAVTDSTLGQKEHANLSAYVQYVGLDTQLLETLSEEQRRIRAGRLFGEQESRREASSGLSESYQVEKALIVLGLSADFTQDDLKKAYRRLAKQYHPDKFQLPGEQQRVASMRFVEINAAYEYLVEHA